MKAQRAEEAYLREVEATHGASLPSVEERAVELQGERESLVLRFVEEAVENRGAGADCTTRLPFCPVMSTMSWSSSHTLASPQPVRPSR